MSIKLLFEDSPGQPISDLLRESLNGANIEFSESYTALFKKSIELINNGASAVFVFRDFPIDNRTACEDYNILRKNIEQYNVEHDTTLPIYVVPIVCSEYILCKMIVRYNYLFPSEEFVKSLLDCTVVNFDYSTVYKTVMNGSAKKFATQDRLPKDKNLSDVELEDLAKKFKKQAIKSLEKLFKYIVESITEQPCLNAKNNKGTNKFYRENCDCGTCEIQCTDTLQLKAERLYTSLPVFPLSNAHQAHLTNISVSCTKMDLKKLKDDLDIFYGDLYNNMLQSGLRSEQQLDIPKITWPT